MLIVTGASHGAGAAAARLFLAWGARVVLAARDEQALETVASEIASEAKPGLVAPTDATDAAAVDRLVATVVQRYGRLDRAFNNAGSGHRPTPLAELAPDEFDAVLDANLRGVFICMRAELKQRCDALDRRRQAGRKCCATSAVTSVRRAVSTA